MILTTYSGQEIDPLRIDPAQIDLETIAVALSRKCRWGGHSRRPMTVAQHSVLVARQLDGEPPAVQLAGLLHDGCEAYCEDLPRPIKTLCPDYIRVHDRFAAAIDARFALGGLLVPLDRRIAHADDVLLQTERRDLWGRPPFAGVSAEPTPQRIIPWPCDQARAAFVSLFERLDALRRAGVAG